ncbi:MAG TPA: TolC family protein [Kofleriaceae bacterium]|nr:TolC family protein [Kofleriaceae bacterium]
MMTRPLVIAVLGSLLATVPSAHADRRSNQRRVADADDDREEADSDGPEARAAVAVKLDDLIEVAVRLSPDLARARADRNAAKGQAAAARKDQQWVVTAQSQYERFATSPDVEVGPFQVAAEDKLSASLGIGRNLPTGGNLGIEFGITRIIRELEIPAGLADQVGVQIPAEIDQGDSVTDTYALHQAQAKLTFKQPLAKGFGPDVALAQEKKADLAATEATIKAQIAAEDSVKDIVTGYWELSYAAYEVDTRAEALELAKQQEDLTRVQMRAGTAPPNALSAVTYEIAIRGEALLAAQNEYEKKSSDLRKKVGLELDRRDFVIKPAEQFEVGTEEWNVDDVLARSRKSNRRIATLILEKRIADVEVKAAKNGMLPQVDLTLSGALVGTGATSGEAFSAVTASNGYQVMAGLTVQFDIGGAAKGAHDAALARRSRVVADQTDTQRAIDTEVVHAVHQVTSARARVALTEKAIENAEINVKAENASFQMGKSTNFNVMQRQSELVQARLRRGRAIVDYHVAVANLQYLGGMLLEQYRVNVRPPATR